MLRGQCRSAAAKALGPTSIHPLRGQQAGRKGTVPSWWQLGLKKTFTTLPRVGSGCREGVSSLLLEEINRRWQPAWWHEQTVLHSATSSPPRPEARAEEPNTAVPETWPGVQMSTGWHHRGGDTHGPFSPGEFAKIRENK